MISFDFTKAMLFSENFEYSVRRKQVRPVSIAHEVSEYDDGDVRLG